MTAPARHWSEGAADAVDTRDAPFVKAWDEERRQMAKRLRSMANDADAYDSFASCAWANTLHQRADALEAS